MYLGIDLGTSNSVIAGIEDGKARVFRPADGGEVLPSVIFIDKRGHRLYGRRAHDQGLLAPDSVASGFKRLMGTATPIEIKEAGVTLTPEECSAEIIRQLLGQFATETGKAEKDVIGVVVTIPAAFNQMQSEATLRAAKTAGIARVDLLQEPIAAAMAAMEGAKRSGQFLVYDLGGGTFDLALVQAINGEVTVVAHQGINMLGGRDFDRMIVNEIVRPWLAATFDLPDNFQRDPQYRKLIRVAQLAAEKAKIELSASEDVRIFASDDEVRLTDQSEMEIYLDVPLARAQFEGLIKDSVMQTIGLIRNTLEENNYKHEDIDRIVFIGGPSRIPLIRQMVSSELGIAADLKTDPMTAVAVGAAYYCESRQWDAANISSPKPKQAEAPAPAEPNLSFAYTARTPDDKTTVTVNLKGQLPGTRQLQIKGKDWDSGALPLTDGLTISLPLKETGEHAFEVHVLDESGKALPQHDQKLTVNRLVASTAGIPAAQTVAVKALEHAYGQNNILLPLVKKGDPLPAEGQAPFKSARALKSHEAGVLNFELFQVEYPERVDLNLCVGLFRVSGEDLPGGFVIKEGDAIAFNWRMSDSGILEASVKIGDGKDAIELRAPRFYAPQAGQVSFDGEQGAKFAASILKQGEEEWGDLAAALGPEGGPEVQLLKTRLAEQRDILDESAGDAEAIRRVTEESRFIRQDIARIGKKNRAAMLQRRLGKMTAIFNRVARAHAEKPEQARFDNHATHVQQILDDKEEAGFDDADLHLAEMRDLFFSVAWRDPNYIYTWYKRLLTEPFLFPDKAEYEAMTKEGNGLIEKDDRAAMKELVGRMLNARIALGASDVAGELATIVKA
ncbi:MAG TPA: Hsp70 family protein [Alphaproteobacteria bacterium]|nr:Hsp70 family protein [Alphaproteobacteria bacterium]